MCTSREHFTIQQPQVSCSSEEEANTLQYRMASFYDLLVSATKNQFENKQFLKRNCFYIHRRLFWGHAILCPQKCPILSLNSPSIKLLYALLFPL